MKTQRDKLFGTVLGTYLNSTNDGHYRVAVTVISHHCCQSPLSTFHIPSNTQVTSDFLPLVCDFPECATGVQLVQPTNIC